MERYVSLLGLFVLMGIAWLLSSNKRRMNWRLIGSGVALQFILALVILRTEAGHMFFDWARRFFNTITSSVHESSNFIFGEGYGEHYFAFFVLPTIIFFSSLMSVLFHLGIIQVIIGAMAKVMVWVMDVSGAESLAAAANVFVGHTEAPLVVRPYIDTMTRSELAAMMTGGMATIAGGVMVAYASLGADPGHLLAASIMSAPASLVIAKIMFPETEKSVTKGVVKVKVERKAVNVLDAACHGASDGLKLALNVGAMMIAFIALVALVNAGLAQVGNVAGDPLTLERILGWLLWPLAWIMGVEFADAPTVGMLLGKKTILNEFLAYMDLTSSDIKSQLSDRSFVIATYALCGFANFGSVAIQIGGLGGLVPRRREDFARLSLKSMIGGALAGFMTATIAGVLYTPPQ